MKENKIKKGFGLFLSLSLSITLLAGCRMKQKPNPNDLITENMITQAIEESNPDVDVHVGEYEHLVTGNTTPVDAEVRTYSSSSILDMPRGDKIYVEANKDEMQLQGQSVSSFMANIVNSNQQLQTISILDRNGNYLEKENNLLSAENEKISISKEGGFKYGEVYQIYLNDAPYLKFENKDPSIRRLTIEIEDDPNDAYTYNQRELKGDITTIDLSKVRNKQPFGNETGYGFDYDGNFPELKKGDVFYATKEGNPNEKLDFYGIFESKTIYNDGTCFIEYSAPQIDDIYNSLRLKGVEDVDFDDAELLLTDELATQSFKNSNIAPALATAAAQYLEDPSLGGIIDFLSKITVNIDTSHVNNRVSFKVHVGVSNYELKKGVYLTVDLGYEKITDYTMDFDVSIDTSWGIPVGVDYKLKCVEDIEEAFYIKVSISKSLGPQPGEDDQDEQGFMDTVGKEINNWKNDRNASVLTPFSDNRVGPSSSGSRTSWPLLVVDFFVFAPFSVRLQLDFYMDIGIQAMAMFKYESSSTVVDFNFTNMSGADKDTSSTINETSNYMLAFIGDIYCEVGIRGTVSVSIFGLHDYIHIQAYAELFLRASASGMLLADITSTSIGTDFSGYVNVDLSLLFGIRAGFDAKFFFLHKGDSWLPVAIYLFRVFFDNAIEHWSAIAATEINMNSKTINLKHENVLWLNVFDPVTATFKDKFFDPDAKYSIITGKLCPDALEEWASGYIFTFTSKSDMLEVDQKGNVHVKDGTPVEFDAKIEISVDGWAGTASDREITIHFHASDAKEVYITSFETGEFYYGEFRPGFKFNLPEAPKITGMAFWQYVIDGQRYAEGDLFTMPDQKVVIELRYYNLPTFTVRFFDSNNNLISTQTVYQGDDAVEPSEIMRDRYLDATKYKFLCWNTDFRNVQRDLDVYAVYITIGEVV